MVGQRRSEGARRVDRFLRGPIGHDALTQGDGAGRLSGPASNDWNDGSLDRGEAPRLRGRHAQPSSMIDVLISLTKR